LDAQRLKEHILDNNLVPDILEEIGCHHIKVKSDIIQCANPDGDNATAICVYRNENLTTLNYTRQLLPSGQTRSTDLLDLVSYIRNCSFFETMKWLCGFCGLDYYSDEEEVPESLQILQFLNQMNKESVGEEDDTTPLKPIDPKVLDYYLPIGNIMFEKDGISLSTQQFFNIGYDPQTNRLTIPIYSEIGHLVGVKGRIFQEELEEGQNKYLYLFKCNKICDLSTLSEFHKLKCVFIYGNSALERLWNMHQNDELKILSLVYVTKLQYIDTLADSRLEYFSYHSSDNCGNKREILFDISVFQRIETLKHLYLI
jgi:DNA primase